MIEIGKLNRLRVVKEVDFGLYLDGGSQGEILLPLRYIPRGWKIDEDLSVFIYRDSEDRLIATTEKPYVMVGEFACLKVVALTRMGAFLDWGLPKDLLVPFSEQIHEMEEDKRYVVRVYLDDESKRIVASARLDDFLYEESEGEFEVGEEVDLFAANKSDLGYKMIVNNSHWGLLHLHELVKPLKRGEKLKGFVKNIREDGKIDIALHRRARDKTDDACDIILKVLNREGGTLTISDKSSPDDIRALFNISKAAYKKAVGSLYKRKIIVIKSASICLQTSDNEHATR
ncbi:MAG: S1-like domain-containing RNA-binding protein [Mariprofundus sp.]|nr:S1-like domain-containing RNA-binding protein [Mariprofundus sp.]